MVAEDVWSTVPALCLLEDPLVPRKFLCSWIDTGQRSGKHSARHVAHQCMLGSGSCVCPLTNQHGYRLAGEVRPALKKSVQQQQTSLLRVVAVAHGLHEGHVVTHHRSKKTAESGSRPQCFERRL